MSKQASIRIPSDADSHHHYSYGASGHGNLSRMNNTNSLDREYNQEHLRFYSFKKRKSSTPQWLHWWRLVKRTLNSLLHFLHAISACVESFCNGGGPLKSGMPTRPLSDMLVAFLGNVSTLWFDWHADSDGRRLMGRVRSSQAAALSLYKNWSAEFAR